MKKNFPIIVYLGIWSISAINSLPGIAISPIMGDLQNIFSTAGEEEIQMLASLPSLLIIPFILISGYLTQKVDMYRLLVIGLLLFGVTGILYLFSQKMWQLLLLSALLGIGAGIVIPLSTGIISLFFSGKEKTNQFGIVSAVSNLILVVATSLTAYLATINWHFPFLVYLLPFITLLLISRLKLYWPKNNMAYNDTAISNTSKEVDDIKYDSININFGKSGIDLKKLVQLIVVYGVSTFSAAIMIFYIPFTIKDLGLSETFGGNLLSIFFLAIMLPGFFINKIINVFKENTILYSIICSLISFVILIYFHSVISLLIAAILLGFGYGIIQPICYDKTSKVALPSKNTIALAYLMTINYIVIVICPILIDGIKKVFNVTQNFFPYRVGLFVFAIMLIVILYNRKSFINIY